MILANGNASLGADQKGTWSATGSHEPCNDGNWTVTLAGKKNGAGTYSGRADSVECYEMPKASGSSAPASTPRQGDIRHLTGNESGLLINTRFASDDPIDWGAIKLRGDHDRPSPATSPRSPGRSTPRRPGTTSRRTARSRRGWT